MSFLSFEILIYVLVHWLHPAPGLQFCMSYAFPLLYFFYTYKMPDFPQPRLFFPIFLCFFCLSPHRPYTKKSQNHFGSDSEILDYSDDIREGSLFAMIYFVTHIYRAALLGVHQMRHKFHDGHHVSSDRHCDADAVNIVSH